MEKAKLCFSLFKSDFLRAESKSCFFVHGDHSIILPFKVYQFTAPLLSKDYFKKQL